MNFNFDIDISIQEILCWIALYFFAYHPPSVIVESMGVKLPILMLATGAGSKIAQKLYNGDKK